MTQEQAKLFEMACEQFEKGQKALANGDRATFAVARLAHRMITAAYNNTMGRPVSKDTE